MEIFIREATQADLPAIVYIMANDDLGQHLEIYDDPLPGSYYRAFEGIREDPNQSLMVVENGSEEIIGTFQLGFIQYLTYQGGLRAQLEAFLIHEGVRGQGVGRQVIEWVKAKAREKNAHLIQFTTNKKRGRAIKFYERMGFEATHEGMKLTLD